MTIMRMDDLTYFARPELSASGCKLLLKPGGPARFKWRQTHPQPPKREFDVGHAAHTLALGIGDPIERYPDEVLAKNGAASTNAAKEWGAEARARGVVPLTPSDYDMVHELAEALSKHPRYGEITGVECELVLTGEINGVPFRGKLDTLHSGGSMDLKTTASMADEWSFSKAAHRFGYHVQAAAYRELMRQNGIDRPTLEFVVVEKEGPYLVGIYELDDVSLALGDEHLKQACELWRSCTDADHWPGYPAETQVISLPDYAWGDGDDIEIDED